MTYPSFSSKNAYSAALTRMMRNFLYCSFSLDADSDLYVNVSYSSRKLKRINMTPSHNGKILGPTVDPYALLAIFVLSMTNKRPISKKAMLAYRSNVLLIVFDTPLKEKAATLAARLHYFCMPRAVRSSTITLSWSSKYFVKSSEARYSLSQPFLSSSAFHSSVSTIAFNFSVQ